MNKKSLIAMGAGLAISLTSSLALADGHSDMKASEMNTGYSNSAKSVDGHCGGKSDAKMKDVNAKCGEGKCGKGKCGEGKCGAGKCGSGKCGAGKCGSSE